MCLCKSHLNPCQIHVLVHVCRFELIYMLVYSYNQKHNLTDVCRCLESHSPSFKAKSSITSAHWPATSSSVCSSSSAPSWQVETHHMTLIMWPLTAARDVLLQREHDFSLLCHSGTRKHAAHRFLHTEKWNGCTTMTIQNNTQYTTFTSTHSNEYI